MAVYRAVWRESGMPLLDMENTQDMVTQVINFALFNTYLSLACSIVSLSLRPLRFTRVGIYTWKGHSEGLKS